MNQRSPKDVRQIILRSITDGVFTVDRRWNITSFNRAAKGITGIPRDRAVGQKCFDVFQTNVHRTRCALREMMEKGRRLADPADQYPQQPGAGNPGEYQHLGIAGRARRNGGRCEDLP